MRYDRLTILLARIIADLDDYRYSKYTKNFCFQVHTITYNDLLQYSYFAVTKNGTLHGQQTGVFRTNCIDCLDRTNVVQSLIGKRVLEAQLQRYSVIKYRETIDSYKQLSNIFKNSKYK